MNHWAITLGAIAIAAVMSATPIDASATTVRPFTMRAMTLAADDIVRGTVIDQEGVYDVDRGYVYTHTFLRVTEPLAGRAKVGDVIVIRQLGGEADGRRMLLVGTATYWPGDDVVVFCRTDGAFHYLVGMTQGSYSVFEGPNGEARLLRGTGNIDMPTLPLPAGKRAPERLRLETLRSHVHHHRTVGRNR